MTACTDDLLDHSTDVDERSNEISFGVSLNEDWTVGRRSSSPDDRGMISDVITMDGTISGDSLYLLTEISDYSTLGPSASRGSLASDKGGFIYDEIEVAAYYYTDSWKGLEKTAPNYFYDETATKGNGNLTYTFNATRYWPPEGKLRFLAYAPSVHESAAVLPELETQVPRNYWFDRDYVDGPRMYMRIPNDARDQQDVLVAYTDEYDCKDRATDKVPLNFQHPLTGIRFVCGEDMIECTIKKISFINVCRDGNFIFNMNDSTDTRALSRDDIISYPDNNLNNKFLIWGNLDTFSLTFDNGLLVGPNSSITSDDNMFFMLPQKFDPSIWYLDGKDVTLEIELEHYSEEKGETVSQTIKTSLMGRQWPAGQIVTYKLTFKDELLEVEQPKVFSYQGLVYEDEPQGHTDNPVAVKSISCDEYRDWDFEILDGGDSWLDAVKSSDGKSLIFSIKDNSNTPIGLDIDANLRTSGTKGSASAPWNLSNSAGSAKIENTANCYMIDCAGTYIFPLVFGNAIKNGVVNTSSYLNPGGELTNFEDYKGLGLWQPYVDKNAWNYQLGNAKLLWQDSQGLIQNVSLVSNAFNDDVTDKGKTIAGIKFEVPSGNSLRQGNAVIAVEDSEGNIMWSWHIWVTNLDFRNSVESISETVKVTTNDNKEYNLMPVNLGWCSGGENIKYYKQRSCTVRFSSGDLTEDVTVIQEAHLAYPRGNQLYYQWGRKDPFVGTTDGTNSKTWYDANGTATTGQQQLSLLTADDPAHNLTTREALTEMIKNPTKWHVPPYTTPGTIKWGDNSEADKKDAKDESYDNLWNNNVGNIDYKTIYDPCPVGYHVSNADAFTGLGIIKYETLNAELSEAYTEHGGFQILTFPITGYRDWADYGQFFNFNENPRACVWSNKLKPDSESSSFNGSRGCAYYMNFTSDVMIPEDFYYTCDGFPVRPSLID